MTYKIVSSFRKYMHDIIKDKNKSYIVIRFINHSNNISALFIITPFLVCNIKFKKNWQVQSREI